jgi:hypothetical protein
MNAPIDYASFGVFPHAREFDAKVYDDHASLSYNLGDIHPADYSVSHNSHTVTLRILPSCINYVIECPRFVTSCTDEWPELASHLERFQHLRWDTVTTPELVSYFDDLMVNVWKTKGLWPASALSMLTPIIEAFCELRDEHSIPFNYADIRSSLPLDGYEKLSHYELLSAHARSKLESYISQREKITNENGVLGWSEFSREQHGYLTMMITSYIQTGYHEGGRRDYRLAPAVIHFKADKPIQSFSSRTHDGSLRIRVGFTDEPARLDP